MKKFVCQVCGYVYEGESAPDACPQCKAPASRPRSSLVKGHGLQTCYGITGCREDIIEDQANFMEGDALRWACILQWQELLTGRLSEIGLYYERQLIGS